MGKGDLRTRRGKIYNGSYGKARPHRARKKAADTKPAPKTK
ncbi:MAG: 30S ribosomal protein THX [Burkholderiaceae bacterium]|nr:30S ribosomal protein THX [Burkholderiaceae bacterium]